MGQTLPNGIYLPAEGERNCYDGLEGNWRSLDSLISTVAGKASATHTHGNITNDGKVGTTANLPLITGTGGAVQAGSFGNQANTFCEGNDSRLSDARTPVAHTHTKSDVTDLLNSNFIPSANNSYDLGSSSYQWNNLYAKNYYYNGTEFQSKFVTTDTVQTVNGVKTFTAYVASIGSAAGDEYSSNTRTNLWLMSNRDTEKVSGILFDTYRQNTAQGTGIHILGISIKENSVRYEGCRWGWYWNNNLNGYTFDFKPTTQGANQAVKHNLGTSTDKWDTINGINPGALSLPNSPGGSGTVNVNYYDLSSIVTIRDGSGVNSYQPVCDGWIAINSFATWIQIANDTTLVCVTGAIGADGFGQCYLPVRKNDNIRIVINQTNTNFQSFKLIPCQGNV